jgi:hypothetical protein
LNSDGNTWDFFANSINFTLELFHMLNANCLELRLLQQMSSSVVLTHVSRGQRVETEQSSLRGWSLQRHFDFRLLESEH